jgi:hypothetical protein
MNGGRQDVTIRLNGKDRGLSIEANPQFKTVNIFDDKGQKISLGSALGKEVRNELRVAQTIKLGKRNGVSVG